MKVLIGCEMSGIGRDIFRRAGHDAWSCDLLGVDEYPDIFSLQLFPEYHIKADVLSVIDRGWDLAIFHPPCTYLTNAGVRWLDGKVTSRRGKKPTVSGNVRWLALHQGVQLFRAMLDAPIPRIAIENPIPHHYAVEMIGRTYDQLIQPWQFGHGETKATCLWLKNLPLLVPTDIVSGRLPLVHHASPGVGRAMLRSLSFPNIISAMAAQWGELK